jgi:hypothetical protein
MDTNIAGVGMSASCGSQQSEQQQQLDRLANNVSRSGSINSNYSNSCANFVEENANENGESEADYEGFNSKELSSRQADSLQQHNHHHQQQQQQQQQQRKKKSTVDMNYSVKSASIVGKQMRNSIAASNSAALSTNKLAGGIAAKSSVKRKGYECENDYENDSDVVNSSNKLLKGKL